MDTITVKDDPTQFPGAVGDTKYVAVAAKPVELFNNPLISADAVLDTPPVNPVPVGANQVYFVFAGTTSTPSLGVIANGTPPQVTTEGCVVNIGMGLINTVNVKSDPGPQAAVEGVTT